MRTRITLAVLALLAAGCSENENASTPEIPVNAKAIRIGQSVQGLTRAVVTDGADVSATVLMCDGASATWSGFKANSSNDITSGTLNARANTATASFKAGSGKDVTLNPTLYYDNNNTSTNSHLVAVAPTGTLAASGTVVTMNDVDGQQDVMYAAATNAGNSAAPESTIGLSFNHLTTQLNFKVKMTEATGTGDWDNKIVTVKNIKVQSAQLPESVNAADGNVTWSTASPLNVPGINNTVLGSSAVSAGNPIMIKGESFVKLDVTLTVDGADLLFSNVPIKDATSGSSSSDLATETGKSHLVTLNVTEPETASGEGVAIINVVATVAPWTVGHAGSGELK